VTPYLVAITSPSGGESGRLIKWDPYTGAIAKNITGSPPGVSTGELYGYPYVLSVQNLGGGEYRLTNWTIENNAGNWVAAGAGMQPTIDDFYARVKGNITWPFSSLGTCDFEASVAVQTGSISSAGTGTTVGQTLMGVSIETGEILWETSTDQVLVSRPSLAEALQPLTTENMQYVCKTGRYGLGIWTMAA
jgi:hypothetical protein